MTDIPELTEAEAAMLRYVAAPGSANPHKLAQRGLLGPQYRDGKPRELTELGRAALEAYDAAKAARIVQDALVRLRETGTLLRESGLAVAARDKRIVQDALVAHDSRVGAELAAQLVASRDELRRLRTYLRRLRTYLRGILDDFDAETDDADTLVGELYTTLRGPSDA